MPDQLTARQRLRARSRLWQACETLYAAKSDDPAAADFTWCPIKRSWEMVVRNTHVFPPDCGVSVMQLIFGVEDLATPGNTMLMSVVAKYLFRRLLIALVPAVDGDGDVDGDWEAGMQAWRRAEVKRYKLKIMDKEHANMQRCVFPPNMEDETLWRDLDGKEIEFRSDFRPHPGFLFWHYACCVLRRADEGAAAAARDAEGVCCKDLQRAYCGAGEEWLRSKYLRAFAEEVGQGYWAALGWVGRSGGAAEGRDDTALVVAKNMMKAAEGMGEYQEWMFHELDSDESDFEDGEELSSGDEEEEEALQSDYDSEDEVGYDIEAEIREYPLEYERMLVPRMYLTSSHGLLSD